MRPSRQAVRRNPHRLGVSGFAGCQNLPVDKSARTVYIGHNASVKRTSAALMAVPLAASMLLAGCGGDAKPDTSSSSTPTSSSTTTAPTTTAPPTSASPTVDPNIPAAARAHTPAGAEAFVRYFYTQLNVAWTKPSSGLISTLSSPSCKSCAALEATSVDLVKKGHRYDGPPVTIVSVGNIGEVSPGHPEVLVRFTQERRNVIDSSGHVVLTDQRKQGKFVAALGWLSSGWSVETVKALA
jgi:hypothetical protein